MDESIKIGFSTKERELLSLLVGSIAGGVYQNPLHIRVEDLDGRESEIRDFLIKLHPVLRVSKEI